MSNLDDAFRTVESDDFSVIVNIASNLKTFLRAVEAQPESMAIAAALAAKDVRTRVYQRTLELIAAPADPDREHPHDAAVAALIWLLARVDETQAAAIAVALGNERNGWWARKVAEEVMARRANHASPVEQRS